MFLFSGCMLRFHFNLPGCNGFGKIFFNLHYMFGVKRDFHKFVVISE